MDNFDERVQAYLKEWEEFKDLKLTHKKLNDLTKRIDKAVEYIEKHDWRKLENDNTYISPTYLLDILKGDDTKVGE